jgi:hypothetical protein
MDIKVIITLKLKFLFLSALCLVSFNLCFIAIVYFDIFLERGTSFIHPIFSQIKFGLKLF